MIKLKLDKHGGGYYLWFNDGTYITLRNEWKQLSRKVKWNWYSFTFINIYFENSKMTGGFEAEITILGLGLFFRHNYDESIIEDLIKKSKYE
ncbi:hypothetical protein K9M47_03265 [Candidatus Gracilibacteria bacterium]|nr:hypothetical protein [Candidatus Gracilibacteria bacterium]